MKCGCDEALEEYQFRSKKKSTMFFTCNKSSSIFSFCIAVPMHKNGECQKNFYPPKYDVKDQSLNRNNGR